MKLLLFSDLHLDRAFVWAPRAAARRRRQGLRQTLKNILDLATQLEVDAVLSGGDLFEQDRFSPDSAAFLRAEFAAIDPLPVFLAPGNHDWFGSGSPYRLIEWSPNVHVFTSNAFEATEIRNGPTIWGAAHRAPANTPNLLDGFHVDRTGVNLALFHGSEQGFFPFVEEGKQPHAPFRAEQIEQAGLAHALLGHFHTPQDAEHYTYPGNPDPLEFGELGERGVVLFELLADGSTIRTRHAVATTSVRDVVVSVEGSESVDALRSRVTEALPAAGGWIRVTLTGEISKDCAFNPNDLDEVFAGFDAYVLRTEDVRIGYDFDALAGEQGTVMAEFVASVQAAANLTDDQRRRTLVTGLRALGGRDDLEVF